MAVMTSAEFVKKLKDVANNYKTLYVMGCFGAPMTDKNKTRYCNNHSYNKQATRTKMIKAATADTFGFDCVNLIKGILWGWNGNTSKTYGGASYAVNGVPDVSADGMIRLCKNVTTDFSNIEVGEAVWCAGHIGVYIGDGLAVECTPAWKNKVQITAVGNIGAKSGYNTRKWTKHGKLPYITYPQTNTVKTAYTGEFPVLPAKGYLGKGDKGTQVQRLQKFLNWYGNYGLAIDGSFGNLTDAALRKYQKAAGLTVDGYFGKNSLAKAKTIKK